MVGADKRGGGSQLMALELGGVEREWVLGYSERQKGKQSGRIVRKERVVKDIGEKREKESGKGLRIPQSATRPWCLSLGKVHNHLYL